MGLRPSQTLHQAYPSAPPDSSGAAFPNSPSSSSAPPIDGAVDPGHLRRLPAGRPMDCPKRSAMAGIPDEAMLEILARVPFKSVCRSKCVAKAWRDLIEDPLNRSRLPQSLQGFFSLFYRKGDLEHCFVTYSASSVPLDIDPCLSFLTKLPEIERLFFLDSCSGLLLFKKCLKSNPYEALGYIVWNPATKQWATVAVCASCPSNAVFASHTYLAFDPAVSSHFHLIQCWRRAWGEEAPWTYKNIMMPPLSLHTYSSETGVWSHSQSHWYEPGQLEGLHCQGSINNGRGQGTFVNGILHLMVKDWGQDHIVAVDVQGRTKRAIKMPAQAQLGHTYIGQSQGRLHCINQHFGARYSQGRLQQIYEVSIWVLQDYDRQEWVLKDTVSFHRLFGTMTAHIDTVVIHPDRNVVFFHQLLNLDRLIAYDMDSKEVKVVSVSSSGNLLGKIVPYIPCFSESQALTNKN